MACENLQTRDLRPFVAEDVASPDTAAADIERFKRQVELYLQDLRRAVLADLEQICTDCCPPSTSP